jgi:energy-coupling factor transporter ATP-binding protein EcfA2
MVFQRAESQLYCATVREDVGVGPACLGLVSSLVARRVDDALRLVGMDPEEFGPRNPHNLSLGEQRRVALAGVLAVEPRLLVLDEVGSGLDAGARRRIMGSLVEWREENPSRSLVFSTHVLEEAAEADRVVLLAQGRLLADGTPEEVLGDAALLESAGLEPTLSTRVALALGADAPCPVDARSLRNWLQKKVRP